MGEAFFVLLALALLGALFVVPVVALVRLASLRQRIESLEAEVMRLRGREHSGPDAVPAEPAAAASTPVAPAAPAPQAAWPPVLAAAGAPAPAAWPPPPAPRPAAAPAARPAAPADVPRPARAALDASSFEQLVGGVWLQNLGSVVLLVGIFLMIVWGYSTGRFGPQVLVASGVALGLALAWRGDRVARRTPRFGHALIGTGLGVVYLTLYLGFTRLHVFGPGVALALLVLVSFGAIAAGLRYRVQAIAAFGVIGAFLPQFLARWLDMPGFDVSPLFLLGFLAAIDLLVFALAARAGWSALDLLAILLSALTWMAAFPRPDWGWGVQLGLAGLFTVLELAPLPRLVRVEGRLRPIDLGVVAAAPLALLGASAPFLAWADRVPVSLLLFGLGAILFGAAAWVDSRRPERDVWVPLTAAATLFVTFGLERALGPVYTSLAWAVEGLVLLVLGLRERGGWLRAMGHAILLFAALVLLADALTGTVGGRGARAGFLGAAALRELGCIAVLLVAGAALGRSRARLAAPERPAPEFWTVAGQVLLAFWLGDQAHRLAADLVTPGGLFAAPPPPVGVGVGARRTALAWSVASAAWLVQALSLGWRGPRAPGVLRLAGAALGFVALLAVLLRGDGGWWTDQWPILHRVSLLELLAVALMVAVALRQAPRRGEGSGADWALARLWAVAASLALMLWSVREARHLAIAVVPPDALHGEAVGRALLPRERALAAALASVAWLAQAVASLALGWLRDSRFLRWCGLGLMGLTLFKFVVFDLQTVDVFWRFLTAIAVGAAMLAFSYAYQRRAKAAKAGE